MVPEMNDFFGTQTNKKPLGFDMKDNLGSADWMNFLIGMAYLSLFILATYKIVVAGADFEIGTPEKRKEGKEILRKVALGVVFALALYPLVNWLRPSMLSNTLSFPGTTYVPVVNQSQPQTKQDTETNNVEIADDSTNRKKLNDAGIYTNRDNKPCTQKQMEGGAGNKIPPCTSLVGLRQETIDMLISLKKEPDCSSCEILITGGTEPGHKTHGINEFSVDLRCAGDKEKGCDFSDPLYKFLYKLGVKRTTFPCYFGEVYGPYKGLYFCNESKTDNHWHVGQIIK